MIKLVIFDLDDTLYNEKNFVFAGFKEVCKYLSKKYNKNVDTLYIDTINILEQYGRGRVFNRLCEIHNFNEDIKKLIKIYRETKPELRLYEDAKEILSFINKKYKTGIITDGMAKVQWNKIRSLNLEKKIDKIIVTDDYGKESWKPSIRPFEIILDYFSIKSQESIYIGDNPNKDFIPCRKLGIHSVRIIREEGDYMKARLDKKYEADYNIKSLLQLKELSILKKDN